MKSGKIKYINRIITISLAFLASCISMISCQSLHSSALVDGISKSDVFFDTYTTITLYGANQDESEMILDECINLCSYYEKLLDANNSESDIYAINNSNANPVHVSDETISLIEKALEYSEKTDGLFDITIYSASKLWDFHENSNALPNAENLSAAVKHVNYKNILIDNSTSTITVLDPSAQLDIGGIAKGYIADKITEYLKTQDISGAIVNLGGDMKLLGIKPDGSFYTVGVNDPTGNKPPICALNITNKAVATSGTYIRYIESDGIKYHHILDPKTGYSVNTDIISATIITDNAIDADTLCTICILMSSNEAIQYIEKLPETEAILITSSGEQLTTSDAVKYIKR